MKRIAIALIMLLAAGVMLQAEELVNLKYLEQEKGITASYAWDRGEITLSKNNVVIKLLLNSPLLITGNSVIRLDTPPFSENGSIFIGNYTYEKIVEITQSGGVKAAASVFTQSTTDSGNPAAAAQPVKTPVKSTYIPPAGVTPVTIAEKPEATTGAFVPTNVANVAPAKTPEQKDTPEAIVVEESAPNKRGRKLIVLDPGHGGNDPGAIGPNKLEEKDVVLGIALRVKSYLEEHPVDVLITRPDDNFITLKNRTVFANQKKADLFVSIHCNASDSRDARGTRTYIYSRVASSKEAAEAAKYENKSLGMLEFLMNDLRKGADEYLSIEAAGNIQHSLVKSLALKWLPTERAPFYVLANTNMPSVLVETAFISNYSEATKLSDTAFRDKIAKGISDGILEYLQKIK